MTEPQRIEITTSRNQEQKIVDAVSVCIYGVVVWYSVRPQDFEKAKNVWLDIQGKVEYLQSIWHARREIRSLPEV